MAQKLDVNKMRVASPCHVRWDSMVGDDRSRFCGSCDRHVYDIVGLSRREIESLVRNTEGRLCVRMFQRADETVLTRDCPIGLRLVRKRIATFTGAALSALFGLVSVGYGQQSDDSCWRQGSAIKRTKADSKNGQISGTIFDINGAVVPEIEIKLQLEKRVIAKTTSDAEGNYNLPDISPAENYLLKIDGKKGWKKLIIKAITIGRSETAIYNLCLEPKNANIVIGIFAAVDAHSVEPTQPAK